MHLSFSKNSHVIVFVLATAFAMTACQTDGDKHEKSNSSKKNVPTKKRTELSGTSENSDELAELLRQVKAQQSELSAKEKELNVLQRELQSEQLRLASKESGLRNRERELNQREDELRKLQEELRAQSATVKNQRNFSFAMFAVSLLMLVIGVVSLRRARKIRAGDTVEGKAVVDKKVKVKE